jgi:ABC-2 type transport system ATP-binding protein
MSQALDVRDLRKSYSDFHLNSVSFSLPTGYIMGFVGQNGAGKTTTIRCILNMAKRESGEITIFGADNIADEMEIKQELGTVFDEIFFVASWRVREVEKALCGFYRDWNTDLYHDFLKEFDLPPDKKVDELSRGMKMKLMLAVAMSHGAKLLILDEPTSGLDPVAREELLDILQDYIADGEKSVFFSTHITSDLERIADYITVIERGTIFYTGTKDGLLEHFSVITGGTDDLTDEVRSKIIGLERTRTGFTGMVQSAQVKSLPASVTAQPPTIDEILIHIAKDGGTHE